jgi:hypothetical protein
MEVLKTDKEVRRRIRKLRPAIDDNASAEIYRLAALQVVAQKLEEVASLLRSIQPQPAATPRVTSHPVATIPMTVENVNKIANPVMPLKPTGPTCQICGAEGKVKNSRGMIGCAVHAAMVMEDDRNEMANSKLQAMLSKGFGDMDVIQVSGNANESE